jgi:hypothetical protein
MNENGVDFQDRPPDFVAARDAWLEEHLDELEGLEPLYSCTIALAFTFDNLYGKDCPAIEFEEFNEEGNLAAGRRDDTGAFGFGSPTAVISTLAERAADDEWVRTVVNALDRERSRAAGGWRRYHIEVIRGTGALAHASSQLNRESIREHGLDWQRMGAVPGIAGSRGPEIDANFLDTIDSVSFFFRMPAADPDVWLVDAEGLWLESGPDGWWITRKTIAPSRLRLADPKQVPGWSEARARAREYR